MDAEGAEGGSNGGGARDLWGWVAVAGAIIGYGSFGVPIKWKTVREARVHPFVFQTYKS
jgi:hypothetical protein